MYAVSNTYLNKLFSVSSKQRRIKGTIGEFEFTEDDILASSFKYSDIAVNSSDIKLGGVFISTLNLTFLDSFARNVTRGTWRDRVINITVGLLLDRDNDIWEDVPLKPYVIDEANHSSLGVSITAYDYMGLFDEPIQFDTASGKVYDYAYSACRNCGVTLGMSEIEMDALPNGTETLLLSGNSDIETWRDLISWVAVTIGGFATINRDGELVFRTWKNAYDLTIDINNRFTGGSWSDFSTNYSAVTVTDIEDGIPRYYAMPTDNGLTLDIGANPLIQAGLDEAKERQARNILNAIQNLQYVPFKSVSLIDPCLDLGDVIRYTDGLANNALCCVMRIDYQYSKGATLQGYGKNPALIGARSKTDKAIAQAAKNQKDQSLTYHTVSNVAPIEITTELTKIYGIDFQTTEQTTVNIWHELKMLNDFASETQTITLYYYVNGDKVSYEPMDTYSEDDTYHILKGDYWLLNVLGGSETVWEVFAKTDNGTAFIDVGDLHAMLWGQKIYAEKGGQIPELSDVIEIGAMPNPIPIGMVESEVDVDTNYHPGPVGPYLDLHDGTYLELHDGTGLELHGGNE